MSTPRRHRRAGAAAAAPRPGADHGVGAGHDRADVLLRAARWPPRSRPRRRSTRTPGRWPPRPSVVFLAGPPDRARHAGRHRAQQGVVPRPRRRLPDGGAPGRAAHPRRGGGGPRPSWSASAVVGRDAARRRDPARDRRGRAAGRARAGARHRGGRRCRSATRCSTAPRSRPSGWSSRRSRCAPPRCSRTPVPRPAPRSRCSGWRTSSGAPATCRGTGSCGSPRSAGRRPRTPPVPTRRGGRCCVPLVAAALLVALAVWLRGRRDVGAGLVAARPGHGRAPRSLSGAVGLACRTQRGRARRLGRSALFVLGAVYGSLTQGVEDMARSNPALEEYFRAAGQGSLRGLVPLDDAAGDRAADRCLRRLLGAAAHVRGEARAGSSRCSRRACRARGGCSARWR